MFAAELLLPYHLFKPLVEAAQFGSKSIGQLAPDLLMSLTRRAHLCSPSKGKCDTPRASRPVLFELREDHRPPGERSAAERYREPTLFAKFESFTEDDD
jgi:hypothetical protein